MWIPTHRGLIKNIEIKFLWGKTSLLISSIKIILHYVVVQSIGIVMTL